MVAAAAAHGIPFACIPIGTRNHFARDVGVNRRDVTGALDALTEGVERLIDIAEVKGRTFLNNVSLGIYGDALRHPAYRETKVRTLVKTVAEVMGPSAAVDLSPPLRFAIRPAALPVDVFYSPGHPITLRTEPAKSRRRRAGLTVSVRLDAA